MARLFIAFLLVAFVATQTFAAVPQLNTQQSKTEDSGHSTITQKSSAPWMIQKDSSEGLLLAKRGKGRGKNHEDYEDDDEDYDDDRPGKGRGKGKGKWKKNKGKRGGPPGHVKFKPYHNERLPAWAQDCGLPPGLAKQNKIPPGWEKKCRGGSKYYDNPEDFRRDVNLENRSGKIDRNSPEYKTVYAMDDAACKVKALENAGSIAEGVAKGAVYGGLLGAATGAVIEVVQDGSPENGAIYGAMGGAAGGATLGGIVASNDYKKTYSRCMNRRGHRVN